MLHAHASRVQLGGVDIGQGGVSGQAVCQALLIDMALTADLSFVAVHAALRLQPYALPRNP